MKKLFFLVGSAICLPLIFAFTPVNDSESEVSAEVLQLRQQVEELEKEKMELVKAIKFYKRDVKLYQEMQVVTNECLFNKKPPSPMLKCLKKCDRDHKNTVRNCPEDLPSTAGSTQNLVDITDILNSCEFEAMQDLLKCMKGCLP